jgi:hypothetical protein
MTNPNKSKISVVPRVIVWPRADPDELFNFDPASKRCVMNCGPHTNDPRSAEERKFLCRECEVFPTQQLSFFFTKTK